ncbi:MAG: hypothetical protein WC807_22065 [Hyphomicrobium sp.]|jgi:hypothetical protein
MSEYTPGPWVFHRRFPDYITVEQDAEKPVGWSVNEWERNRFAKIVFRVSLNTPERAANARLIAESPVMAENLEILHELFLKDAGDDYAHSPRGQIISALLARINGESK